MYDARPRSGGTEDWLQDMLTFCQRAESCTWGLDQSSFVGARDLYESCILNLALIGEAASNVPETFRAAHPEIPWRLIIDARNRLMHRYWGINNDIVWDIVQVHVPALTQELMRLLKMIEAETE